MSCSKVKQKMLNYDAILKEIEPENLIRLERLDIFESINSTNSYLLECAKAGMLSGSCCFAERQSQGRGRQGNTWFSPPGNIYFSLLWCFSAGQIDLAPLSLAIGVAVVNALKKYGVTHGLQLKWPNDIWFGERKLGGILLESLAIKNGNLPVVIGIGLNVDFADYHSPDWIDLAEITNATPCRNKVAGLLLNELLAQLPLYQTLGFKKFIDEWRALDGLLDKTITMQTGTGEVTGRVEGINQQGELLLKSSSQAGSLNYACACGQVTVVRSQRPG